MACVQGSPVGGSRHLKRPVRPSLGRRWSDATRHGGRRRVGLVLSAAPRVRVRRRDVRRDDASRRGAGLARLRRRSAGAPPAGRAHPCPTRGAFATRDSRRGTVGGADVAIAHSTRSRGRGTRAAGSRSRVQRMGSARETEAPSARLRSPSLERPGETPIRRSSEGEDLRFELQPRPSRGPEGGEHGHKQRWHVSRERDQSPGRMCNGGKGFGVSGRDSGRQERRSGGVVGGVGQREKSQRHISNLCGLSPGPPGLSSSSAGSPATAGPWRGRPRRGRAWAKRVQDGVPDGARYHLRCVDRGRPAAAGGWVATVRQPRQTARRRRPSSRVRGGRHPRRTWRAARPARARALSRRHRSGTR